MSSKRRLQIRLETHEITTVRFSENRTVTRFCPDCAEFVRQIPIARAALLLEISETAAFRLVENKQIHSTETETGALLICEKNLLETYPHLRGKKQVKKSS